MGGEKISTKEEMLAGGLVFMGRQPLETFNRSL